VTRRLQHVLEDLAAETPWDAIDTPGAFCRHGDEPPFCEEWSCLTGEPETVATPPLRAPLVSGITSEWLTEVAKELPIDREFPNPMASRPTRKPPPCYAATGQCDGSCDGLGDPGVLDD
jgi:hypothetical protein